jgi:hypothetical protein
MKSGLWSNHQFNSVKSAKKRQRSHPSIHICRSRAFIIYSSTLIYQKRMNEWMDGAEQRARGANSIEISPKKLISHHRKQQVTAQSPEINYFIEWKIANFPLDRARWLASERVELRELWWRCEMSHFQLYSAPLERKVLSRFLFRVRTRKFSFSTLIKARMAVKNDWAETRPLACTQHRERNRNRASLHFNSRHFFMTAPNETENDDESKNFSWSLHDDDIGIALGRRNDE